MPSNPARKIARTEHVGSLRRPRKLLDEVKKVYEIGHTALMGAERKKDLSALHAAEDEAIRAVVKRQIETGIDVISDGEFRRVMFTSSFYDAIDGIAPNPNKITFVGDDGSSVDYPGPPVISGKLRKIASPGATEAAFMRKITDHAFKVTFPAASWQVFLGALSPAVAQKIYDSPQALAADTNAILKELVRETADAGANYIQFDEPAYLYMTNQHLIDLLAKAGLKKDKALEAFMAADRAVIAGLPDHVVKGFHICRGNYRSRHMGGGKLDPVAEALFSLPYDRVHIEWEDHARQGDFSALRYLPKNGPIVSLGVMSSKSQRIETEDELIRQVEEAAKYVPVEQLALAPQCGFASALPVDGTLDENTQGNEISDDVQWRKLEVLVRAAKRIWG